MVSCPLGQLPEELLAEVAEYVDYTDSRWHEAPDLLNLMCTCKAFFNICYPILYRRVSILDCQKYLMPLAFRFFTDKHTASMVRSLECLSACSQEPIADDDADTWRQKRQAQPQTGAFWSEYNDRRGWPAERDLNSVLMHQIETLDWESPSDVTNCFLQVRNGQRLDIVLMLLLPSLVNLESLELEPLGKPYHDTYRQVFQKCLQGCNCQQKTFGKLTDACFAYEGQDEPSQSILPDLMRLPAIKRLTAWSVGTRTAMKNYLEDEICKLVTPRENIKDISMHRCGLTVKTVGHILSLCPTLETFLFSFQIRRYAEPYNTSDLEDALYQRRQTLRRLWLSYELGDDLMLVRASDLAGIGRMDFRDFYNLQQLCIAAPLILGGNSATQHFWARLGHSTAIDLPEDGDSTRPAFAETLPDSLVSLTVEVIFDACTATCISTSLLDLLQRRRQTTPLLREMKVRLGNMQLESHFHRIQKEAERAGVRFDVGPDSRHMAHESEIARFSTFPAPLDEIGRLTPADISPSIFAVDDGDWMPEEEIAI